MSVRFQTLPSVLALGALLAGCDAVNEYIPTGSGKSAEAERARLAQQEQQAAAERQRESGERMALRQHVLASCKSLESSLASSRRKFETARSDRETLAARIREHSSASGEDGRTPERHVVLSRLLADEKVNALAGRYMDRDFRMVRLEFIESMREANGQVKRREEALNRNQADYDKAVASGSDDAGQSRQAVQKAAVELRKTIAELEKRERDLQRSVSMTSGQSADRRRRESELRDVSYRLRLLQRDYDEMRTNRESNDAFTRAAMQASRTAEQAQWFKQRADEQVRRTFAGLRNPAEITSECEALTIGELERRIIAAMRDSEDSQAELGGCVEYLKSVLVGVDRLNLTALQKVRADVDSRLAGKAPVRR